MRQLNDALQPFKGRGVSLRVETGNKLFLNGAEALSPDELAILKASKPLFMLFVPQRKNYRISQILTAIKCVLDHSSLLVIDGGYDNHEADLRSLPLGYNYLKSIE